jgi:DNA-binding CsgD family transcriptional regulator
MLRGLLANILDDHASIVEREKGVAFLAAARSIYLLTDLYYFCANISRSSGASFVHCAFSSDFASQAITSRAVSPDRLADLEIVRLARATECAKSPLPPDLSASQGLGIGSVSAIALESKGYEIAFLGYARDAHVLETDLEGSPPLAELKILGDYFHSHMLRRNGMDTSDSLVVSARELDCLRWVAAGKSAWEASIILGISERTVRFHLNSAREKLDCATTTQAVAKVVAQQLISV